MEGVRPQELGFGWRDALWALVVGAFVLLFSARSYDRASTAHSDGRFVGILADPLHVAMGAVYGAFVRETLDAAERPDDVAGGSGLFVHNEQTTEPHAGTLLRPWEFLLGYLARLPSSSEPAAFVFHLERRLSVVLFCLGLAWLASELFARQLARALFLGFGVVSGNLYWLVDALGRPALLRTWLDTHMPGVSGLGFSYPAYLLGVPHLTMELACLAAGLAGILAVGRRLRAGTPALPAALLGGPALFGLAAIRPYSAPILFVLAAGNLGAWVLADRRRLRRALEFGGCLLLPAVGMLAFDARALAEDSVFHALDVVHPSPPLLEQVLFLGAPALGALLLLPLAWRRLGTTRGFVVVVWVLLGTALSNAAPLVAWEVEALSPMALAWLALFGLLGDALVEGRGRSSVAALGALALVLASGLWATHARELDLDAHLASRDRFLWMSDEEAAVIDWLSAARAQGGLSRDRPQPGIWIEPRPLSQLVPWLAGTRVFLGHPDHTPESGRRLGFSESFRKDGKGLSLLAAAGVTHLVSWPRGGADPLDGHPGLRRVWEAGPRIDRIRLGPEEPRKPAIGD